MGRRAKQQPRIKIVYRDAKGKKKWTDVIELKFGGGVQDVLMFSRAWCKENPGCKFIAVEIARGVRK